MRRPNWKRQGLAKLVTDKDRRIAREKRDLEYHIKHLPAELQNFAKEHPALVR